MNLNLAAISSLSARCSRRRRHLFLSRSTFHFQLSIGSCGELRPYLWPFEMCTRTGRFFFSFPCAQLAFFSYFLSKIRKNAVHTHFRYRRRVRGVRSSTVCAAKWRKTGNKRSTNNFKLQRQLFSLCNASKDRRDSTRRSAVEQRSSYRSTQTRFVRTIITNIWPSWSARRRHRRVTKSWGNF